MGKLRSLLDKKKAKGEDLLDEPEEFIDAYHGSPHLFDKFDSSKIGTGEGAQAYSHGLYAAQREGVARNYRDRLTDSSATFKHSDLGDLGFQGTRYYLFDFLEKQGFSRDVAGDVAYRFAVGLRDGDDLNHFENFLKKNAKDLSMTPEEHSALLAGIPEAQKFKVERPKGHLYKVKIKTGEQNLLDWDTPLKDQPKPIQDKVLKIYSDNYSPEQRAEDQNLLDQLMTKEEQAALPESNPRLELTGAQVHDDLVQYHNRENSKKVTELNEKMSDISKQLNEISTGYRTYRPRFEEQGKELSKQYDALMDERSALPKSGQPAAAQNLLDAGIPGVKYDDALSRGKEERTKNYVIYSDELIDIAKRYGIPVATVSMIAKASGVTGLIAAGLTPEDAQAGIRGYHGSPAKFDQFSDEFMGTGEGAQAYGRGHYLAEVEDTAVDYRNQLTPRDYDYEEWLYARYKEAESREDYGRMEMYENAMMHESPDEIRDRYSDYDEDYQALADEVASEIEAYGPKRGYVYQTDVDAELDDLIDYDLPLSQQSQKVQEVMASFGITDPDLKGSQLYYKVIDPETPVQQAPELATRTLNEAGIKGIRYADGFSRGQDGGTSNYVIFDPNIIDISRRYGIPVTAVTSMLAAQEADAANARKMQAESNTNFAATRDSKNNMWDGLKQSVSQASSVMPQQSFIADTAETMGRGLVSGTLGVLGNLPMEGSLGRMGLDYFGIGPEQIEGYREDIKADPLFEDPNNPYSQALNRAMETSLQYISPYVSEFTSQPEIRATLGSIGDWYSSLSPRSRGILSGAGEYLANLPK